VLSFIFLEFSSLGTHLFVKVPRLGDSEVICDLFGLRVKLPPVTTSLTSQR